MTRLVWKVWPHPQAAQERYFPGFLAPRRMAEKALTAVIQVVGVDQILVAKCQAKQRCPRCGFRSLCTKAFLTIITNELTINFEEDFGYPS